MKSPREIPLTPVSSIRRTNIQPATGIPAHQPIANELEHTNAIGHASYYTIIHGTASTNIEYEIRMRVNQESNKNLAYHCKKHGNMLSVLYPLSPVRLEPLRLD
jgi:hypothetical protein